MTRTERQIEKHRVGTFTIEVRDAEGRPSRRHAGVSRAGDARPARRCDDNRRGRFPRCGSGIAFHPFDRTNALKRSLRYFALSWLGKNLRNRLS